jgi:hypothetical protein
MFYGINSIIWILFHTKRGRERLPTPVPRGEILFKTQSFFPAWTDSPESDGRGTYQNKKRGSLA